MSSDSPVWRSRYETATTAPGAAAMRATIESRRACCGDVTTASIRIVASISPMSANLIPDAVGVRLLQVERADYERDQRNGNRISKPGVDVPRLCDDCGRYQWKESTKPPVAEMIRQRHRRIPDPRRERFYEECRNWPGHHRHEHDLDEDKQREHGDVHRGRIQLHCMIDGNVRQRCEKISCHHDPLSPDAIRQCAENYEQRRAEQQGDGDDLVRSSERHLQDCLEKEEGIELPSVPDYCLTRCRAEKDEQKYPPVAPRTEAVTNGSTRRGACFFHSGKKRRFLQANAYVVRHRDEQDRQQERDSPSPLLERLFTNRCAYEENHKQRYEQSESCGRLNEARVVAALSVRRVLSDVHRGAPVIAAQCKSLKQPKENENYRSRNSDRVIARKKADRRRRATHDQQRHQEREFSSDEITDSTEHERAKRPHCKTHRKRRECFQEIRGWI